MEWLKYLQITLAVVCWIFMGIYVYIRVKEIRNERK